MMETVCAQLLGNEDLEIDATLLERTLQESIVSEIIVNENGSAVRIYSTTRLYLSNITPLLHNFGFSIVDEVSYILKHEKHDIFINRFNLDVKYPKKLESSKAHIQSALNDALLGRIFKQCKLFALVFSQNISIREVMLLRAFLEYINQAVISINLDSILSTYTSYPEIMRNFVDYFLVKFDPKQKNRHDTLAKIDTRLQELIKAVPDITDDKIMKLTYAFLENILRTNYFLGREEIAFKIDTKSFAQNLRGLQPNIESFVYHQDFSGVHLRMSRISRGGLRWSERTDDYRQEIKSLMITQEGKNSIIIPDGAKGGFVIHKERKDITKEFFTSVYSRFIENMLDLVDNMVDGKIVKNEDIVCYDGDDAYFVVAADKGTASMSDVANAIAVKRGYWLGDAFASGGSNGYGHKELGITAKGAMVSSSRFFIEKGVDFTKESITVVGIGSMNGDVFGNGMLYSKHFILLGAISHKEIFIDPDPIPQIAFEERQRLFLSKNGSWSNYSQALISKGGGVFLRSDKQVELTPEMCKMFSTEKKYLSGEELAQELLKLNVDMLFNGGVGTYVKSSEETNLDIGDKQNEGVRIDANELRAQVVCEGGNLGFTQKARIEYALGGGKINLDGIDNAAGVNTSDHEVNLKILLNTIVSKKLLRRDEANRVLKDQTDFVVKAVLWNNYLQSLAISRDEYLSKLYLNDFITAIEILEQEVSAFNRKDFFIPKNENIREVIDKNGSIVRPILSFLLSYSKIFIKNFILTTAMPKEVFAEEFLFKYFPKSLITAYEHEIKEHPLRDEIIATVIADKLINLQGVTFIGDYLKLGRERFLVKIKSYLISNQLFGANDIRFELYRSDYKLDIDTQYALLNEIEHTLNFSTRWMVKYLEYTQLDALHILDYKSRLFTLLNTINPSKETIYLEDKECFNRFFIHLEYLRFAVATIVITQESHHSFENVAELFYRVVNEFKIITMINALDELELTSQSDRRLARQLLQFIEFIVVHFTQKILDFQRVGESANEAFENYILNDKESFDIIKAELSNLLASDKYDVKEIAITVNQLLSSAI